MGGKATDGARTRKDLRLNERFGPAPVLVVGVAASFFGLFTFKFEVGGPEDAGEEDDDNDGYDDERGSDVHGVAPYR